MAKREKTKYPGVYERELIDRNGRVDVAFDIAYRHERKKVWETIGRKSEGVNAAYAARLRAERLKRIEANDFVAPGEMLTFAQAAERFLSVHMAGKPSAANMRGYLEHHVLPVFGAAKMDRIRPMHIEELKKAVRDKGLSPQTERHVVAFVRQVYRKARARHLYEHGDHQPDADTLRPIQGRIGNRDHFPAGQFCRAAKCRAVAVDTEREREKDRIGPCAEWEGGSEGAE